MSSLIFKQYERNFHYFDEYVLQHRNHQNEACLAIKNNNKGQIILPTGTGKSRIINSSIVKEMINFTKLNKFGILSLVAHRLDLCEQTLENTTDLIFNCGVPIDIIFLGSRKQDINEMCKEYASLGLTRKNISVTSTTKVEDVNNAVVKAKNNNRQLLIVATYNSFFKIKNIKIDFACYDEAHELTKENFSKLFPIINSNVEKNYYFTATQKVFGIIGGMANEENYGKIIYSAAPRDMIDKGEMVSPCFHFINTVEDGNYNNRSMRMKSIIEGFKKHKKWIKNKSCDPNNIGAKLLIQTTGSKEINEILNDDCFKQYCIKEKIKVFSFSSQYGYTENFIRKDRKTVRRSMCSLPDNVDAILIHCDILTEGIDLPSITGVMLNRLLTKSKLLQAIGRGTRLLSKDRQRIYSGEIKPNEYDKFIKPNCAVLIPEHLHNNHEDLERTIEIVETIFSEYGIVPIENIDIDNKYLSNFDPNINNITNGLSSVKKDKMTNLQHEYSEILKIRILVKAEIKANGLQNLLNKIVVKTSDNKKCVIL